MPKKDAACAVAALKEALTLRQDRNLHQITGSRVVRIQADGGREFSNQKLRDLCWRKSIILSFSPAHQPSSNGIAERMVGILKSTVRRVLKQAHLDREWWSYACRFAGHMMREKVLGREWAYLAFLTCQTVLGLTMSILTRIGGGVTRTVSSSWMSTLRNALVMSMLDHVVSGEC